MMNTDDDKTFKRCPVTKPTSSTARVFYLSLFSTYNAAP